MKSINYRGLFLFFFVVGLPLISWYYLKKGIDFRIDRLSSIANKLPVPVDSVSLQDATYLVFKRDSTLPQRHLFVFSVSNDSLTTAIQDLQLQFTGIPNFEFVLLGEKDVPSSISALFSNKIMYTPEQVTLQGFLFATQPNPNNRVYLIDSKGDFRKSYPLYDQDSLVFFVQESATLLPVKSGQELRFKRKQEI
jgi:hypothetical protein